MIRHCMVHSCAVVGLMLLTALAAFAEGAEPAAKFELADVHPSARSTNPDASDVSGGLMHGGRYHLRRATMLDLVRMAYGVDAKKVLGGPNWLEMDRFDIRAKAPAGTTATTVKPMLQALLAERFGLVVHEDKKPVPAWALTAAKHTLLKKAEGSDDGGCHSTNTGELVDVTCHNMPLAAFVSRMTNIDGAWNYVNDNPVVDQTGLDGGWDFEFKFSRRVRASIAGAEIVSLFDGLEKIGLKLDPALLPMPVVVVDRVNRTPTPNPPDIERGLPPVPTEFEVAEVKPTDPDYHGDSDVQLQENGRLNAHSMTLKEMIEEVWGVTDEMLVGAPKFAEVDRWDIVAKAPDAMAAEGDADVDSIFTMMKALLADRFKLAVHYEDRPISAYTMTAPKPKLKMADPASRTSCKEGPPTLVKVDPRNTNPVLGRLLTCTNASMAYLAEQLPYLANGYVHSPVQDSTGLDGGFDFTLSFSTAGQVQGNNVSVPGSKTASDPNGAIPLPEAMEKQLGLKMELQKRPLPVLVIDHIEEKPTDN